jgi:comEA protein
MLGFTPEERKAIIFLVVVFLIGTAILTYKRSHPGFAPGLKAAISELPAPDTSASLGAGLGQENSSAAGKNDSDIARQEDRYFGSQKVNLNRASQQALEKLPNIGPAMAKRIIDYRQQKGGFKKLEDLRKVKGIGAKRLSQLVDHVTVE